MFYLISIIIGSSVQNISKKAYSKRSSRSGAYLFAFFTSIGAALFFLLTSKNLSFQSAIFPYSLAFALSYATATIFSTVAMSCGPMSLSSLVLSYSLMLPTFFGLIFLKDPISAGLVPGLVLLIISLLLINKKSNNENIQPKWILFIFLAFLGNGMCSVIQKLQQIKFGGEMKNEFMIIALVFVAVFCGSIAFTKERGSVKRCIKHAWYLALICGIANGLVNLFVMLLYAKMQISLIFPIISAGGIVLTGIISKVIYKEHLSKSQLTGYILGLLSVILLNI